MGKTDLLRLMAGFRRFRERYFSQNGNSLYDRLASQGQSPKTLVIACSDSRVDPAILTDAAPGELFIVRNVANLVPPFESVGGLHGVSSAIEFAVVNLKVENVVVLGHRQCGGIHALMTLDETKPSTFVNKWVAIGQPAKVRVLAKHKDQPLDHQVRACEMESIITSLANLKSFPFVQEAIEQRGLSLFGVYFDLEQGHLFEYDDGEQEFKQMEI